MGAFYLLRLDNDAADAGRRQRLHSAFEAQGFGAPALLRRGGVEIGLYAKLQAPGLQCSITTEPGEHAPAGDFVCFSGTVLLDDTTGAAAARGWLAACAGQDAAAEPDWERLVGNFCALVQRADELSLFLDPLGVYKVYHDLEQRVFASSLLAVAASCDALHADAQAVYEYVFHEATYGGATPLAEVREANCLGRYVFGAGQVRFAPWPARTIADIEPAPMAQHVDALNGRLRDVFARMARAFPARIDTALSGGYDSRLTYALLVDAGVKPAVHVYGADNHEDVLVAKGVAAGEGITLEHVNKGRTPLPEPDAFGAILERNFQVFDGAPPSGIFDGGADLVSRGHRCANGGLMLNGGGGEVFRNFFYLPPGAMSSTALVSAFYNRYDPAACTERFSDADYRATFARNIEAAVGTAQPRLRRAEVEYAYPAFRCRFWMGRNNAINNRLGYALTPFVELPLALASASVALKHKNHGRLEAAMIRAISPRLAAYPSAYGHGFDVEPPRERVAKDWLTLLRPPALRRYTYRLRHRKPPARPKLLQPQYLSRVVDPALPLMSRFIVPARLFDNEAFGRACTLEYLFGRLSVALD